MATLLDVVVPLLVIIVMTVLGMDPRVDDFRRVREYPILVPAVVLGQWALVTLGAGAIVKLLPLASSVAGSAPLVAAAPVAALRCLTIGCTPEPRHLRHGCGEAARFFQCCGWAGAHLHASRM